MTLRQRKGRLTRWVALAPIGLVAVFPTASALGQSRQSHAVFSIRGRITLLAADGNRAAVTTTVKPGCGRIVVWTAPGSRSARVKPGILGCSGDGVSRLAVGDGRVAWIEQGGGNNLELIVMAAKLGGGAAKQIEFATNGDRAGANPAGTWVGQLRGSGALLAYNSWTQTCARPAGEECGERDPLLRLTGEKLVRIVSGRRLVIARDASAYPLAAVGGGRLAVETAVGVTIRSATGAQIATVSNADGSARAVALSRTALAIERTSTLDLYDPVTGTAVRSLPLGTAAGFRLVDLTGKLALLRGPHRVVLARLSDGKRISVPLRPGAGRSLVGARLTEEGLFYAYNTRGALAGRVVFEPARTLLARF